MKPPKMPVSNFEAYTFSLTDKELAILPTFLEVVKTGTDHKPLKAPRLVEMINIHLRDRKISFRMTDERFRKFVNYVRSHAIIPLIATSHGYFVSYDPQVIRAQMTSLRERAGGILAAREGLATFIHVNTEP